MLRRVETNPQRGKPLPPRAKGTEQGRLFPEPCEGQDRGGAVQQELSAWRDAATASEMNQHRESPIEEIPSFSLPVLPFLRAPPGAPVGQTPEARARKPRG